MGACGISDVARTEGIIAWAAYGYNDMPVPMEYLG